MRAFLAISLVATMLALTGTAAAQQPLDHERCGGKGGVTPEQQIDACATLVGSGQLSPQHLAGALNNRGSGYQRKQQYDRAIQDYDQAIRLNPNVAIAYYNRGLAYASKDQYDHAIEDFDQAIRLDPSYAKAFYNRGIAYRALGQQARTVEDFAKARQLNPNLPPPPQ